MQKPPLLQDLGPLLSAKNITWSVSVGPSSIANGTVLQHLKGGQDFAVEGVSKCRYTFRRHGLEQLPSAGTHTVSITAETTCHHQCLTIETHD